jgi:hypothetical protein
VARVSLDKADVCSRYDDRQCCAHGTGLAKLAHGQVRLLAEVVRAGMYSAPCNGIDAISQCRYHNAAK